MSREILSDKNLAARGSEKRQNGYFSTPMCETTEKRTGRERRTKTEGWHARVCELYLCVGL
jgi:hypothetical protein